MWKRIAHRERSSRWTSLSLETPQQSTSPGDKAIEEQPHRTAYNFPMTSPQEQIESDLKQSMKAGERERVATLRLLLSSIKNEAIRLGEPVDETTFVTLLRRGIKQRQEAATAFRDGGREESAAKEEREAEILAAYLPQQADESELRQAVVAFIGENSLSGPSAMGPVMKAMMERFAGRADGSTLSRIVREALAASD